MEVQRAVFVQSAVSIDKLPAPVKPEYAFVGRSNVGKSSLINSICGMKKLAITSSKPGRTQTINHFLIDDNWYIVDLPGYGYAKSSKKEREKWLKMMKNYLLNRKNLVSVFLLVDARVPVMDSDLEFIEMLGKNGIPFSITFTKSDQLRQTEMHRKKEDYIKALSEGWEEIPPMIITSAIKGRGKKEILQYIKEGNEVFYSSEFTGKG